MVGFAHPFHTTGETFFDHLAETKVIGYVQNSATRGLQNTGHVA
jgi:hypothetical protein